MATQSQIRIGALIDDLGQKCNDKGSLIEYYKAIALLTEIVKLQQKEIERLSSPTTWGHS